MSKKQIENKATENPQAPRVTPAVQSTLLQYLYGQGERKKQDLAQMKSDTDLMIEKVQRGDMSDIEGLLVAQTLSLNAMFDSFATILLNNRDNIKVMQAVGNMAFKAQSQSRATIEALTALKYPKQVVIAKQANIAQGHQQVNNGELSAQYAHTRTQAREISNQSNELLEGEHGTKTMDGRTTTITARENPPMETVAAQHRRKNGRG